MNVYEFLDFIFLDSSSIIFSHQKFKFRCINIFMDLIKSLLTGAIITFILITFVFKPFGHYAYLPIIIICILGIIGIMIYLFITES